MRSSGSFDGAPDLSRQFQVILFAPGGGDGFLLPFAARGADREDQKDRKPQF
ncbi:MAG: hypothetical protein ABSF46_05195 [Terriglobia bacterium]